jgi:hypothetical protein
VSEVDDNKAELLDDDRITDDDPDVEPDTDDVGTLVAPGGDGGLDVEDAEVASEAGGPGWPEASVLDKDEVTPAEEDAVHLTDAPPMGDGDGYVED